MPAVHANSAHRGTALSTRRRAVHLATHRRGDRGVRGVLRDARGSGRMLDSTELQRHSTRALPRFYPINIRCKNSITYMQKLGTFHLSEYFL